MSVVVSSLAALLFAVPGTDVGALVETFTRRVESKTISIVDAPSEQFQRFERLRIAASDDELVALVAHDNPAVRVYAAMAIAERKHAVGATLSERLDDAAVVEVQDGCEIEEVIVADAIVSRTWEFLSPDERQRLARRALKSSAIRTQWSVLLDGFTPSAEDRGALIKGIERTEGASLIPLGRLGRPEDHVRIVGALRPGSTQRHALRAIEVSPDRSYLPALSASVGRVGANELAVLYGAVAATHDQDAVPILARVARQFGRGGIMYVLERDGRPIDEHFDARYEEIYWWLLEDGRRMTEKVLAHLRGVDPDRASRTIHERLRKNHHLEEPLVTLLITELERTPADADFDTTIATLLPLAAIGTFTPVAAAAARRRSPRFIKPLMAVARRGDHSLFYVEAARALMAYQRPDLQEDLRRIAKARRKRATADERYGLDRLDEVIDGR